MKDYKIYNQFNAPKGIKQNKHQEIYEYDYIDPDTKEIKHKKINTQEKIQSNLAKCDYKAMIARGELVLNGSIIGEGVRDCTTISGDKVDIVDTLIKISKYSPEEIDAFIKTATQEEPNEPIESSETNDQTTTTTEQTESNNS